ncbi:double-strand-break repair protein rad21-like protein 1, partial [Parambassis ranga]|uniref:Double-strand-break repair protein rad21-like protein 1 n=1 Tax=Parambassis ranga TaxID=210632 RepID=A0A6P7IUX6_9TELE
MVFYMQFFTSKRGPLAKIWLAAHWESKLTKAHVFECNLEATIRHIISPKTVFGLRTSGHLLLGVVRIYCRKAKYLLADCSDALLKIKVAFRPGQIDLPAEGLEASVKAITLAEDFTSFDLQMPDFIDIDAVDHFSLNQSRTEDITLKEDVGNDILSLGVIGEESQSHSNALLDENFCYGDTFGDEDQEVDLLEFLTNSSDAALTNVPEELNNENLDSFTLNYKQDLPDASSKKPMDVETSTLNETTLLDNEERGYALEPVTITANSEKKKGKRKRKLLVDQAKQLSNESIKEQLSDYSDVVAAMDLAPPTVQLMQWKENGGAHKLLLQPCSTVVAPEIKEIFAETIFKVKSHNACEEVEEMRQGGSEVQRDLTILGTDVSVDSSIYPETMHISELTALDNTADEQHKDYSQLLQDENRSEFTHPELPSEDSMFVHPSILDTQSASLCSQSVMNSQSSEEKRMTRRAQKLLDALKVSQSSSDPTFSLEALCEGSTRSQAASMFFCLLLLKK